MGKTFKDKNKNRRFNEFDYDSDYQSQKSSKQNAKRFRQDRGSKRSIKEDDVNQDE